MQVLLWDKLSQAKLKSLERHRNSIRAVCIRQSLALSGSRDRTALLWDLETGQAIRELKHSIDVRSVYLNITADDYKDIYIWDIYTSPDKYQRRFLYCIESSQVLVTDTYVLSGERPVSGPSQDTMDQSTASTVSGESSSPATTPGSS